jgi:hypothetical protein
LVGFPLMLKLCIFSSFLQVSASISVASIQNSEVFCDNRSDLLHFLILKRCFIRQNFLFNVLDYLEKETELLSD